MICHIVLFRPRASLTAQERDQLIAALRKAVDGIPQIQRVTIGKRLLLNRSGYETMMAEHFDYAAVLEFGSEADLRTYLDHPAHVELGQRLFTSAEAVLAYDFAETALEEFR